MLLVIGGAGFIGSNFVLSTVAETAEPIVNLDKLTYAGNPENLSSLRRRAKYLLVQGDICDRSAVRALLRTHRPRAIVHFAAENDVDSSIAGPADIVQTNVVGTWALLEEACQYWGDLSGHERSHFRFLHISTDEVYGSLGAADAAFTESTPYAQTAPTRHRKLRLTTSYVPTITHTACRL